MNHSNTRRQTHAHTDTRTDTHTDRQIYTDRHSYRQIDRDRPTNIETQKQIVYNFIGPHCGLRNTV